MGSLVIEVRFDERVLTMVIQVSRLPGKKIGRWYDPCNSPSTIPQIQQQIAHKSDVAMLYVDGSTKPPDVLRHVVAEDDRSHGRLARTGTTHQ